MALVAVGGKVVNDAVDEATKAHEVTYVVRGTVPR